MAKQPKRAVIEQWADFADHVLEIAREIQFRGYRSPEAVSLVPTEGTVMRYVIKHPAALPSEIAEATGLQRTNLSTVLRGLEDKELVERVPDAQDGRSVRIHPTPRAIRNYALVRHEWAAAAAEAAGNADVGAVLPLLEKVRDGMVRSRRHLG